METRARCCPLLVASGEVVGWEVVVVLSASLIIFEVVVKMSKIQEMLRM